VIAGSSGGGRETAVAEQGEGCASSAPQPEQTPEVADFLRMAADKSERILVVANFQPTTQQVEVDLTTVATAGLVDLEGGAERPREWLFKLMLPAYGYKLYQVRPAPELP
jgi:hypothetical protein